MERETSPSRYISYLLNIVNVTQTSVEFKYDTTTAVCPTTLPYCVVDTHKRKKHMFKGVEDIIFDCLNYRA